MAKRDNLIANTKRSLVKELRGKLIQIFASRKEPAAAILPGNDPKRATLGVRLDVFDPNYPDGAIIYAITRWGDLIYSFPGEIDEGRLNMADLRKFELPKGIYHDITPDDLYIEGISSLIAELERTYGI